LARGVERRIPQQAFDTVNSRETDRASAVSLDEKGHLRLEDIRLVQGDPKDPILDLTGNLNASVFTRRVS
jgi:hypothetical protein